MAAAENSKLRVVLFGPPGSGKGTQAEILAHEFGIPRVSTGDILRDAIARGTELGVRVREIMAGGGLVDDETMAAVIQERLARKDARAGFILDGYPRNLAQAAYLERVLEELGVQLDAVVFIKVPEQELVKRTVARRRVDDAADVVRHRLEVYHEKTEPLVEHYRGGGLLREVDGHQPVDRVAAAIRECLEVPV